MSRIYGHHAMTKNFLTWLAVALAALGLAACNAGSLLKTGSLTTPATPPAPKPSTAIDRALHVAATSARAHKCGFYFDAAALRGNFLTAEGTRGTAGEALTKTGQSYDYTALKVAASIKDSETYCSKARNASIKKSLQSALTGNFEPPVKKAAATSGGLAGLLESDSTPKPFDRGAIYDPVFNDAKKKY